MTTKKIEGNEIVELYNANEMSLGKVSFLKDGYIINIDNEPLHNEKIHGLSPQRWHIYAVKDNAIIQLISLNDIKLAELIKYLKGFVEHAND